jgi:hypothetical protein
VTLCHIIFSLTADEKNDHRKNGGQQTQSAKFEWSMVSSRKIQNSVCQKMKTDSIDLGGLLNNQIPMPNAARIFFVMITGLRKKTF